MVLIYSTGKECQQRMEVADVSVSLCLYKKIMQVGENYLKRKKKKKNKKMIK